MRVLSRAAWLAIGIITLTWVVFGQTSPPPQTLSPGEVRLSSRPYQPGPNFRLESRLVQLEVVVRDKRGRAVPGLTKADFAVLDSGKNRELIAFSVDRFDETLGTAAGSAGPAQETQAPPSTTVPKLPGQNFVHSRWIGLLFDDINTAPGDLAHAKIAATRFIREAIRSGDRIAVFTTSGAGDIAFTSNDAALLATMAKVQSHPRMSPGGLAQCPRMTAYEAYQILNRDPSVMLAKVLEACACSEAASVCGVGDSDPGALFDPTSRLHPPETVDIVLAQAQQTWNQARLVSQATLDAIEGSLGQLARMPGRRMLLLASSGFLTGTLDEQLDLITNEALHAGVVINSLDAKGLYAEAPGPPINESVESWNCRLAAPYSRSGRSVTALMNSIPLWPDSRKVLAASSSAITMTSTSAFANWVSCPPIPTC